MFNESIFQLSFENLKDVVLNDLTVFDVALSYVLLYVVYKALGRYIYFKPQEHASKINRTFLLLSLLVTLLHFLSGLTNYLPILPEYRWLFALCSLALLIAPFSILTDFLIWSYDRNGFANQRYTRHMPIQAEYYKVPVEDDSRIGNTLRSREIEGVKSTRENLHSDALMNLTALAIFLFVGYTWTYESIAVYGWYPLGIFVLTSLWVTGSFLDRGIFSWIEYFEPRFHLWWAKFKQRFLKPSTS